MEALLIHEILLSQIDEKDLYFQAVRRSFAQLCAAFLRDVLQRFNFVGILPQADIRYREVKHVKLELLRQAADIVGLVVFHQASNRGFFKRLGGEKLPIL